MDDQEENILEAIYEDDDLENDDVEMVDIEEGEFVDANIQHHTNKSSSLTDDVHDPATTELKSKNRRRRANKKRNKRKISGSGSNATDINRFVLDICRRLKEKKSYMVYTAVGCLGVSAISDLIKEEMKHFIKKDANTKKDVDAVQACGGQTTADGRRLRTGGGILWNIIKLREPNAYKEIMKRAKEFEKQFKQPNIRHAAGAVKEGPPNDRAMPSDGSLLDQSDSSLCFSPNQNQSKQSNSEEKRPSVHDRLRIPVSYDDDLLQEDRREDKATA